MVADEADETSISTGWVVLRKLTEFQELHRKLRQLCPGVKNLELPSQPLKFFGKTDKNAMEKAKVQIQKYLNVRSAPLYFYILLLLIKIEYNLRRILCFDSMYSKMTA